MTWRQFILLISIGGLIFTPISSKPISIFLPFNNPLENLVLKINTETNSYTITTSLLANTELPVIDIEITDKKNSSDKVEIFISEGGSRIISGNVGYLSRTDNWEYELIFSDNRLKFSQLALRNSENSYEKFELIIGHNEGLTVLERPFYEEEWTNYTLLETEFHHPWELVAADLDPKAEGEEILLIQETALLDVANFWLFSYNGSWHSKFIYSENPVTRAASMGEFNTSHPGLELMCVNEEGYATLLQLHNTTWNDFQYEWENISFFTEIVRGDFYPASLEDEFVAGVSKGNLVIFSKENQSWKPEILHLDDSPSDTVMITDIISVDFSDSEVDDIIAVSTDGSVWLISCIDGVWNPMKLWQDSAALFAIKEIPQTNSIIVGGASKKITEITLNQTTSTTTTLSISNSSSSLSQTTTKVNFLLITEVIICLVIHQLFYQRRSKIRKY
jgi:hypothetical protein